MVYVEHVEDSSGDIVDILYYCSAGCYTEDTGRDSYGHACPGGAETDYDVYCSNENCGELLWEGLSSNA